MSNIPTFTMRQLLEAGVHYGHTTRRWNPKMKPFLFGERNRIHIIDLDQTVPMLGQALQALYEVSVSGGRVLFVGTKRQAQDMIKEYAVKCGQYYVNHRWLGGTMTNWKTVSVSIRKLKELEERLSNQEEVEGLTKRERLGLMRQKDKYERALGGIKDMGGTPDILFVIDTNKDQIAVQEAVTMGLPVVAVIDSNSTPEGVTYPIPGNDDARRAIKLYCELAAQAVLNGLQASLGNAGIDIGSGEEAPQMDVDEGAATEVAVEEMSEAAPEETAAEETPPAEETSVGDAPAEENDPAPAS